MSEVIRARWVLPIDRPPIENGWIETAGGRVLAIGRGRPPEAPRDLGAVALLPGLVNAHTHLELSWMANLVPPAASMVEWIRTLLRVRETGPAGGTAAGEAAMRSGAELMRATGTALVGDVANGLATAQVIRDAGLGGVVFHELLGFAARDPAAIVRQAWGRVRIAEALLQPRARDEDRDAPEAIPIDFSVVAHAPYSVSPGLFREIVHRANEALLTVHLAESPEEIELLSTGRGPLRTLLEDLGLWTGHWQAPRTDPTRYLAELGYLRPGVLVVHGVYLTDDALDRLRRAGAVLVTCPRSNLWVGTGPPRLSHFYASGVPVAIGTDSLASSPSLNMFDELAEMRRIAPDVAAASMLESATRVGAEALGFSADFGTIAPGKRACFVAVDVPDGIHDVEEYLVSGVPADRVRNAA